MKSNKKTYISLFLIMCVIVVFIICLSSPNTILEINEIKALFSPAVHINYDPKLKEIDRVEIGGAIRVHNGPIVYRDKYDIARLTMVLNELSLVEAKNDELPNMSSDSYIQYCDKDGNQDQIFTIYGEAFIKDVNKNTLYRVKYTNELSRIKSICLTE